MFFFSYVERKRNQILICVHIALRHSFRLKPLFNENGQWQDFRQL